MLDGKLVLVTGASRGIGKAIALTLGEAGATVIGTATTESGADNISKVFAEKNISGKGMKLNVTNNEQISDLVKTVNEDFGSFDILVNNAGITRDTLLMRMSEEQWDEVINTNLKSAFNLTKAVQRPMLKARKGSIVNMSSVVGVKGNAGQANYAASKAGLIGFTKSVAAELGSRNIRCNAIAPGFIETEMTEALDQKVVEEWRNGIPLKRGGSQLDVANATVFLASDMSAYVTGQTLHVCGGMLM